MESSDSDTANGAFLLARALESSGWATTPYRLYMPFDKKLQGSRAKIYWAIKGRSGVKNRTDPSYANHILDMGLGTKAIEIRSLMFKNIVSLDRTLRSAFLLGAALRAYQKTEEERDRTSELLAKEWEAFQTTSRA